MKVILLSAVMGLMPATPVADVVPTWNIQTSCKSAVAADGASGANAADVQGVDACVNDETQARDELTKNWTSYPAGLRTRCEGEAGGGGISSYVDLIVCLQTFTDPGNKPATTIPVDTLRGAGKHRRKAAR
jgi:hypothetical protein